MPISKPKPVILNYQPCLVPEDVPVIFSKYPAYTERLLNAVDECNQRNQLISQRNRQMNQ